MSNHYSSSELMSLNAGYPWRNCIIQPPKDIKSSPTNTYTLHATGDADLNGRKYIPLPVGTKITEEIKRKYNLM